LRFAICGASNVWGFRSTLARFAAESPKNSEIFARRTTSLRECRFSVFFTFASFQGLFAVFFFNMQIIIVLIFNKIISKRP
jgi:hypothetical protein